MMSIFPKASIAVWISSSGALSLVRSPLCVVPSVGSASCTSCALSPSRSLTTTFAPCSASSSAVARPMPWPAPVTMATLSSSSPIGCDLMAVRRGDGDERVTELELFFDLVFVFAITEVTALMAHNADWAALGQGMLVLAALWFAWAAFAWLTNIIDPDEGSARAVMFGTMAGLLVCSLAVPHAFDDDAAIFGVAYLVVRSMQMLA